MTNNRGKVLRSGQIMRDMMAIIWKVRRTEMAFLHGLIVHAIKGNLRIIILRGRDSMHGLMEEST